MENIKSYIESGILELYVLGDLDADERLAVETMAKQYPEVKAEILEIERAMNKLSDNLSVEPSIKVRERFFNSITFSDEEDNTIITNVKEENTPITVKETAKIVSISSKKLNFYKFSFAACLALLAVSIVAIINLNNSLKDSRQQIAQLQTSNQNFANRVNFLDQEVTKNNEAIAVYSNPDFKMVKLNGTANAPTSNIIIAFNAKQQKVMVDLKNMKLPKNDESHQYQLWALVDGKPVDLGVFDAGDEQIGLKDMKSIGVAQAFAVTLEPKGGSVNPTMEQMMVMGAI